MNYKGQRVRQTGPRIRAHFLGAARAVTGSFHLFEVEENGKKTRFFIDCGRIQEDESLNFTNRLPADLKPAQVDFNLFSHAHDDHIGHFPKLVKDGYTGVAYATKPTEDLMGIMLPDSGFIQEQNARLHRSKCCGHQGPLYTEKDARRSLKQIRSVDFYKRFSPVPNVTAQFLPSSHLLGAAAVKLEIGGGKGKRTIVFSGDIGRPGMPMLKDMTPVHHADYIICESTYGNRLHPKRDRLTALADVINRAYGRASVKKKNRGYGAIIVPVFAMGRAQEFLYDLRTLQEQGRIPRKLKVCLDGPMAVKATEIYRDNVAQFPAADRRLAKRVDLFRTANFTECKDAQQSALLDQPLSEPTIIVSSSGMASGGRVVQHLRHRLPGSNNTIIFVGHQAEGTRGALLVSGDVDRVRIGKDLVKVRATVEKLDDYSGHADYEEILDWLSHFQSKPKKLFLVHGDAETQAALKARIEAKFGWDVVIPQYKSHFDLT